jgi:flagellar protein FlaG
MEIQPISNSGGAGYSPGAALSAEIKPQSAAEVVKPTVAPVAASVAASVTAVQAASSAPKPDEVKESVNRINKTIQGLTRNLEFTVDEDTKMNVVKVVDTKTKDVIRQFPSEEVLVIAKALDKLQGLLLKDRA